MNADSLLTCALQPTSACLTSPTVIAPLILAMGLAGVGFLAWRSNVQSFRRLRRRILWVSGLVLGLVLALIGYFFAFDPETVRATSSSAGAQTVWAMAVSLLGAAVALSVGALAFALGGRIGKWTSKPQVGATAAALVIAIDGPAASGKGTLARRLARHYQVPCLDTGLLYRAVARDVMHASGRLDDVVAAVAAAQDLDPASLDDDALRASDIGDGASIVARIPEVRAALLAYQHRFARQPGGAVLDGRDIGTVVCPDADIKLFITATPEERARRRHLEHRARGLDISYADVFHDIQRRDARDRDRSISPLEPAADAIHLETTGLDADAVFDAAMALIVHRRR